MFVFLHSKLYIDCVYVSNEKKKWKQNYVGRKQALKQEIKQQDDSMSHKMQSTSITKHINKHSNI